MGKAAALPDDDGDELVDVADDPTKTPVVEDDGNTPDPVKPVVAANEEDPDAPTITGKPHMPATIPFGRFKEVNDERTALLRQNAEMAAAMARMQPAAAPPAPAAPAFDVRAKMKEQLAAVVSGEDDKALELSIEIHEHNLKQATKSALEQMRAESATQSAAQQHAELNRTAAELIVAYPQLDPKGAAVDADAIDFVVARRDRLIADGHGPAAALRLAVATAATRFGLGGDAKPSPTNTDPAAARMLEARQRAAAALNQQPADLSGKGDRATQVARKDVSKMSDEEFNAIPEAEKKRLRGDI